MFSKFGRALQLGTQLLRQPPRIDDRFSRLNTKLDNLLLAQGTAMARSARQMNSTNIHDYEFKAFSQFGEDGIIQFLISRIAIPNRTFIEFGVEDFMESNCRFLLMHDSWSGFTMDGSAENVARTRQSELYWRHDLNAVCAFVDKDNVSDLLRSSGFGPEPGILSIDLDGVDYHIWSELDWMRPAIMIAEYNSIFGPDRAITVPYDRSFDRRKQHHSNVYFGCSLAALDHLARQRGYSLVGSTTQGVNAFFVRNDLLPGDIPALTVQQAYIPSKHRDSRDKEGNLTFVRGADRLELMRGLPVVNVVTGETEML
jgi:hypothetical protein